MGEATGWSESSLNMIAVMCDKTKIKILELGDKIVEEREFQRQKVNQKIEELLAKD